MHHLTAYGNRGSCLGTVVKTYYKQICHAVKGLHKTGQKIGERKSYQISENAPCCQTILFHPTPPSFRK